VLRLGQYDLLMAKQVALKRFHFEPFYMLFHIEAKLVAGIDSESFCPSLFLALQRRAKHQI
jgi:hypothetical protein